MTRALCETAPMPIDPDPPYLYPDYVGTRLRSPKDPLAIIPHTLTELTGPAYGESALDPTDSDLTQQYPGEPHGQRIIVSGRVLGSDGRPLRGQLIEIWQANAAGRYRHDVDTHDAPLDPNFGGAGRAPTRGRTTTTAGGPATSTSRCSAATSPSGSSRRCTSPATR